MSSLSSTFDKSTGDGQGYVDSGDKSTTSIGSSILGSTSTDNREVEETDIMLEIDTFRPLRAILCL